MTTTTSKKLIAAMLAIATLFGVVFAMGNATVVNAADDAKVQLYSMNRYFSKYGGSSYEVYVQTKDNAADQHVYIHYFYLSTMDWQDTEATYFTTLADGSKIWKAYFSSFNTQFAIKYVADGATYWDNNNGNDYTGSDNLGAAKVVSERLGYQYYTLSGFKINAILQNLAYNKEVFVRYTTNNWQSYQDVALSYSETNANGTETWTTYIYDNLNVLETGDFQYAICYRVNGNEYWDNNFGANYDRTYHIYQ